MPFSGSSRGGLRSRGYGRKVPQGSEETPEGKPCIGRSTRMTCQSDLALLSQLDTRCDDRGRAESPHPHELILSSPRLSCMSTTWALGHTQRKCTERWLPRPATRLTVAWATATRGAINLRSSVLGAGGTLRDVRRTRRESALDLRGATLTVGMGKGKQGTGRSKVRELAWVQLVVLVAWVTLMVYVGYSRFARGRRDTEDSTS